MPEGRTTGAVMNYTSGHHGQAEGRAAPADGRSARGRRRSVSSGMLFMFQLQPFDDNVHICGSPLYHTAVLVFAGGAIHAGHTVVLMDKWAPDDMLRLIDKYRVTNTHMVPTQFVRLLALPDDVKAKYDVSSLRHMVHAAAPCPPDVKRQMLEWWGPVIDEYYAASEGGGTIVFAEEWLEQPGTVGKAWAISEIVILDDDGNELPPPARSAPCTCTWSRATSSTSRTRRRPTAAVTASSSPSATSATSTTTAGCSCPTARPT